MSWSIVTRSMTCGRMRPVDRNWLCCVCVRPAMALSVSAPVDGIKVGHPREAVWSAQARSGRSCVCVCALPTLHARIHHLSTVSLSLSLSLFCSLVAFPQIYNISAGKNIAEWLKERKKSLQQLRKDEGEAASCIAMCSIGMLTLLFSPLSLSACMSGCWGLSRVMLRHNVRRSLSVARRAAAPL